MSKKKDARILGIRLDEAESVILAKIEAKTTFTPVALARAAITAVIRRWKADSELSVPFHIITSAELAKMNALTTEAKPQTASPIVVLPQLSTPPSERDIALLNEEKANGTEDHKPKPASYTSGIRKNTKGKPKP